MASFSVSLTWLRPPKTPCTSHFLDFLLSFFFRHTHRTSIDTSTLGRHVEVDAVGLVAGYASLGRDPGRGGQCQEHWAANTHSRPGAHSHSLRFASKLEVEVEVRVSKWLTPTPSRTWTRICKVGGTTLEATRLSAPTSKCPSPRIHITPAPGTGRHSNPSLL